MWFSSVCPVLGNMNICVKKMCLLIDNVHLLITMAKHIVQGLILLDYGQLLCMRSCVTIHGSFSKNGFIFKIVLNYFLK